ncbi:ABC transporter permease [Microvirga sp. 2TAF3]|uniref:ABC transporter permease n=1 Tax=Microvirga sp. 2TAF3 TaxID=3233014 RepID=UPI003F9BE5A5
MPAIMLGILRRGFSPTQMLAASKDALRNLWTYRALCRELVRRDLIGQYAGQLLGSFWVVGHPLFLLLVYIFVFVVVMKVKLAMSVQMPRDYTNYILAGLVPWLSIQQLLTRSTTVLIAQANLVKQVVFPMELLPFGAVFVTMVPLFVGMVALIIYQFLGGLGVPITVLLAPLFVGGLFLFLSGLSFILSSITPFFRDLKDFIVAFTVAGVFLVPAVYLPDWVPETFAPIIYINPFSYPIWVFQDIFYYGRFEHPWAWVLFFSFAVIVFAVGCRMFRKIRPYIANVL